MRGAIVRHREGRRTAKYNGHDPIDVHVGERLRDARHLAGISQTALGDGIGVSFQAVQKYERGENRISASRLYAAARIVAQPVSYFFDELEGAHRAAARDGFSNDEIELIRSYRQLPDDKLRDSMVELTKRIGNGANVRGQRRRKAPSKLR